MGRWANFLKNSSKIMTGINEPRLQALWKYCEQISNLMVWNLNVLHYLGSSDWVWNDIMKQNKINMFTMGEKHALRLLHAGCNAMLTSLCKTKWLALFHMRLLFTLATKQCQWCLQCGPHSFRDHLACYFCWHSSAHTWAMVTLGLTS